MALQFVVGTVLSLSLSHFLFSLLVSLLPSIVPLDALGLRYQTCILDRYPRTDYKDSPLSNTTAVFCQPSGAQIQAEPTMPTFLSFVLTDCEGEKMYAVTVTFYDEMSDEMVDNAKRSVSQTYAGLLTPEWPKSVNKFYSSKSVCVLSYFPFFQTFRECLKEIYRVANSPGKIPIEVSLSSLALLPHATHLSLFHSAISSIFAKKYPSPSQQNKSYPCNTPIDLLYFGLPRTANFNYPTWIWKEFLDVYPSIT